MADDLHPESPPCRTDWIAAYCVAFRCVARVRGWQSDEIESGWLDAWPYDAWAFCDADADPYDIGGGDVLVAEVEARDG